MGDLPKVGQSIRNPFSPQGVSLASEVPPSLSSAPRVELAQTEDLETTEETVYTTGIAAGMDDESLIQVNVSVSQTGSAITNPASHGMVLVLFPGSSHFPQSSCSQAPVKNIFTVLSSVLTQVRCGRLPAPDSLPHSSCWVGVGPSLRGRGLALGGSLS